MSQNQLLIGYDIYTPVDNYNHNDHYEYAQDKFNNLYKCCYGYDGEDKYITCYEKLNNGCKEEFGLNEMTHLIKVSRLPFQYIYKFDLKDLRGLSLDFQVIEGKECPCFIRWNENKCFVLNR